MGSVESLYAIFIYLRRFLLNQILESLRSASKNDFIQAAYYQKVISLD